MDVLVFSKLAELKEMREGKAYELRVAKLTQQADALARATGTQPESWNEFKLKHETSPKQYSKKEGALGALLGIGFGLAVAGGMMLLGGVTLTGLAFAQFGLVGGVVGAVTKWEQEARREKRAKAGLINEYESYLEGYSRSPQVARTIADGDEKQTGSGHAERVQQTRDNIVAER